MENPTKEGYYTTIFRDGSIIHANLWMVFPDGHGKWYWNEEARSGIIAWFSIPEGGYKSHNWYKLPEEELKDVIMDSLELTALYEADVRHWEGYNTAFEKYCNAHGAHCLEELADNEMNEGYYAGYKINE